MAVPSGTTPRGPATLLERLRLVLGLGGLVVLCGLWMPMASLLGLVLPAAAGRRCGRSGNRLGLALYVRWLRAIGACELDVAGLDALRGQGPMVLAPNHPSLLDAVLVLSRLPGVACVMKASLLGNPLLGGGARLARYIPNTSPLRMVQRAQEELQAGAQLLLFPEGTRTERAPVNPVQGTVGLIARRAGVPVQAIIIETDSGYLGKGWPFWRRPPLPVRVRVRLGRRFDPPADVGAFNAELERHFVEELGRARLRPPVSDSRP